MAPDRFLGRSVIRGGIKSYVTLSIRRLRIASSQGSGGGVMASSGNSDCSNRAHGHPHGKRNRKLRIGPRMR